MTAAIPTAIPPAVKIGPFSLPSNVLLAPMAGVTDRPFRILCRRFGAGLAASEMLTADVRLWDTPKSRRRMDHTGEPSPRVVQIAGFDPAMMADAAQRNVDAGAEIIDINMGCPAKKVCNRLAGSALMQDEALVARILQAVGRAVTAPVMLKTRTGCAGVMIGRAAQGRPWIFDEVNFFLSTGEFRGVLALEKVRDIMRAHLEDLYAFYGDETGVRVARKHLSWYFRQHLGQDALRSRLVRLETPREQLSTLLEHYGTGVCRA